MKKIYYIANIRLPTEKAHGLASMKMCEAFAREGAEVRLIVPRRFNTIKQDPFGFYNIQKSFSIKSLPCVDMVDFGKVGFLIQSLSFAIVATLYAVHNAADYYYGRDEISLWLISFFKKNIIWEAHTAKTGLHVRSLIRRSHKLIVISSGLKNFYTALGAFSSKIMIVPSGVDLESFKRILDAKEELREKLGLPADKIIVAYIGKESTMGKEKGVGTLRQLFEKLSNKNSNIMGLVVSDVSPSEVPFYMKASDILVMNYPDTPHFALYMSPLKMFEYMASGKIIVSVDLPTIKEVLNSKNAILVKPGNSEILLKNIEEAAMNMDKFKALADQAQKDVEQYTWQKRAAKVLVFIS